MGTQKQHVVILPYYCADEVARYIKIADHLAAQPKQQSEYYFMLAASPLATQSEELKAAYERIAPTFHYRCPTQVFGYPEGPTAMFWDCMDHIAERFENSSGFSLWLESDMCPTQPDWIDRLSDEWYAASPEPIMMGCYVPEVYKHRVFRKPKRILDPHINGGACYSIGFGKQMPEEAREGVFDVAVYKYAVEAGRVHPTDQITFSDNRRVRRDLVDKRRTLLHGFMQDKDQFIENCVRPVTAGERNAKFLNPLQERMETLQRKVRVLFVRKGHRAMLENMLLAKQKMESERKAA